ncbi:MAG TPA: PadR family transcriptional regulator [Solirubrobacteraceae bacterium]|nr:PadR family transcriptional regulator [Solirubrobacteraceae bacterium]
MTLTPTSYIVLGLLEQAREATPYELKQRVAGSVGDFWSIPHSQLYAEPERLRAAGLLHERREAGGRRRRLFSLTQGGRDALAIWRAEPTHDLPELRDPGLLKLFFGADQRALAAVRRDAHRAKLAEYQARRQLDTGEGPRGPWHALDAGIAHEREWVRFWTTLADE